MKKFTTAPKAARTFTAGGKKIVVTTINRDENGKPVPVVNFTTMAKTWKAANA